MLLDLLCDSDCTLMLQSNYAHAIEILTVSPSECFKIVINKRGSKVTMALEGRTVV